MGEIPRPEDRNGLGLDVTTLYFRRLSSNHHCHSGEDEDGQSRSGVYERQHCDEVYFQKLCPSQHEPLLWGKNFSITTSLNLVLPTDLCGLRTERLFFPDSVAYLSILNWLRSFPLTTSRHPLISMWTPLILWFSRLISVDRSRRGRKHEPNLDGPQSSLKVKSLFHSSSIRG